MEAGMISSARTAYRQCYIAASLGLVEHAAKRATSVERLVTSPATVTKAKELESATFLHQLS